MLVFFTLFIRTFGALALFQIVAAAPRNITDSDGTAFGFERRDIIGKDGSTTTQWVLSEKMLKEFHDYNENKYIPGENGTVIPNPEYETKKRASIWLPLDKDCRITLNREYYICTQPGRPPSDCSSNSDFFTIHDNRNLKSRFHIQDFKYPKDMWHEYEFVTSLRNTWLIY